MNKRPLRRVVVTGMGVVSSLGSNVDELWGNLKAGKSGIDKVSYFDTDPFTCKIASEVKDFDPTEFIDPKEVKRTDRYVHFSLAASKLAMQDANLKVNENNAESCGVLIGTGIGGMATIQKQAFTLFEKGARKVSPFLIPSTICNIASGSVAIEVGARGPNYGVVSACASSAHSIGAAFNSIQLGDADIMITGGSEASITELSFAGFCSLRAMSTAYNDCPQKASRPFDSKRDGFVMGEGSGILILESLESALARNAKIYCEILGYSATCDAFHITKPDPECKGLKSCFEQVIKKSEVDKSDIDYINVHGTSTYYNDLLETKTIKEVFGERAKDLRLSSTKSMTGHLLGAAGAVEAIATIKTIQEGVIPPTINYEYPDPECDLNYTVNESVNHKVDIAISNNLGFGGQNAALMFKRYSG